jgi:putative membrane protein
MDPPDSTISKAWIWCDGGVDFGVPLSNYIGWLLTSGLFYTLFALHRRASGRPLMPVTTHDGALRMVAILFYLCPGLTQLVPLLLGRSGAIADATGHLWRIDGIRLASALTMLLTMFPAALLAATRLRQGRRARQVPGAAGAGA